MCLPQPCAQMMKTPRVGQKRKRQPRTHQCEIQGHPGQSSSANSNLLPLDAVAGLPEEVPGLELDLNIEGFDDDIDYDLVDLDQLLEPPKDLMDAVPVLNSRRTMSMLVDVLVRDIPQLEFVQPARESLQSILECCNVSAILGYTKVVSAEDVMQALVKMRGALSSVTSQQLVTRQETLNLFTNINREVDVLEQQCLQAMNPPLPASHSQPHGLAAPSEPLSGVAHSLLYNQLLAQPLPPVVEADDQVPQALEQVEPYKQHPSLPLPHVTHESKDQGAQAPPAQLP